MRLNRIRLNTIDLSRGELLLDRGGVFGRGTSVGAEPHTIARCQCAGACSSCAYPDLAEHNKTPAGAFRALTGVISSESGQAVFPSREGKLHCQCLLMQFHYGAQLKLMLERFFLDTDDRRHPLLCLSEGRPHKARFIRRKWWAGDWADSPWSKHEILGET